MEQQKNVAKPVQNLRGLLVGVTAIVGAVVMASNANAALTLDSAAFITDIGTAETFGIAIGLAILGFVAVMALVKKSRGAVK